MKKPVCLRVSDLEVGSILRSKGDFKKYRLTSVDRDRVILDEVEGLDRKVFLFGAHVDANYLKSIFGLLLE